MILSTAKFAKLLLSYIFIYISETHIPLCTMYFSIRTYWTVLASKPGGNENFPYKAIPVMGRNQTRVELKDDLFPLIIAIRTWR